MTEATATTTIPRAARRLAAAIAAAVLLAPAAGHAWHANQADWDALNAANPTAPALSCTSCHTLSSAEGEPGTSYINSSSRTLPLMKAYNGGAAPASFGCTFCHSTAGTTRMRGVLSHFQGVVSGHPAGRNFVSGLDTGTEYLSGYLSATAGSTDCLDCHDAALVNPAGTENGYVSHAAIPPGNPFLLQAVTVAGEYDDLCRLCHGAAAAPFKGEDVRVVSHGDASGGAQAILEDDGTPLRTTDAGGGDQCRSCHDTHYSGRALLFNDGHEGDAPIVSGDCTGVCHYPGDPAGDFATRGHGMAQSTYRYSAGTVNFGVGNRVTMGFACTACHNQLDTSDTSASRRPHVAVPSGGTTQERYRLRFNLDNIPVPSGDEGSDFGNPLVGVCTTCHPAYTAHIADTGAKVGCQDCHDEHAEGSGAGNLFMIPTTSTPTGSYVTPVRAKAGVETVTYDTPKLDPATGATNSPVDFYVSGSPDGVCDNAECHPAYTPLSSYMTGGAHSGSNQAAGSNCGTCHRHTGDAAGGWRALSSCNDCHTTNGATHGNPAESSVRHTVTHATTSPYIAGCTSCHPHAGSGALHADGTVEFANNISPALDYPLAGGFGGGDCTAGNGCHSAAAGAWAAGTLACTNCHSGTYIGGGANLPASGLHGVASITRHDATLLGGACVNCHAAAGPSSGHANGTLENPDTAAFTFAANVVAYDRTAGCQAVGACHGVGDAGTWRRRWLGVVDAEPGTPGNDAPGDAVCQNCHGDFSGWRWDEADPTTAGHTDPYAGNTGDRMDEHAGCERCHGWGNAAYDRTWKTGRHGNGVIDLNGPDATHGTAAGAQYDDATGGCLSACHGPEIVMSSASGWTAAYGDFGSGDCGACHGPGGTGPTVVWPAGNATGRRTSYGSHLGATTAEEANGFLGGLSTWRTQCNKCHSYHDGTVPVPSPPTSWSDPSGRLSGTNMQAQLGLAYANEAGVAVHLGGTAQGGASEAEFCWGCHDANAVSEWGFNTKTTPAGFPVVAFATPDGSQESQNYGWIYTSAAHTTKTSDWTQGWWMSQYDTILQRRIASMHSASFDPAGQSSSVAANVDGSGVVNHTSPAFEGKPYLRCSYCHDVHDTLGPAGKPYVRGTWMGNPYPAELPPRSTYAYTKRINTGPGGSPTPRGLSTARDKGGFFIDQNSNWPTQNAALDSLAETAGLCTLCHGTNVDTMDFYGSSKLWLPTKGNGHSNSCLGGTGTGKSDLFTGARGGFGMGVQGNIGWFGDCGQPYPQSPLCSPGWCVPNGCNAVVNAGWYWGSPTGNPVGTLTPAQPALAVDDYENWYGVGTIGGATGAGSKAHAFTCSKCHSPHASGLPALLIQNCIDPALSTFTTGGQTGVNLAAFNCHRKTARGDGWHYLAPGQ